VRTAADVAVVARSGVLLVQHGTPYLPVTALSAGGWLAYNPYLPVMALFGLPHALGVPGDTRPWLTAVTFLLLYAAFLVTRGPRAEAGRPAVAGQAAFWLACPAMAFPLTMGITDPPVIALTCLALALLARGRGRLGRLAGSRVTLLAACEVLGRAVAAGRRGRVHEVEGALPTADRAFEGLHRQVGSHAGGLVERRGEDRRRAPGDVSFEVLLHDRDTDRQGRADGRLNSQAGRVERFNGEGSVSSHEKTLLTADDTRRLTDG